MFAASEASSSTHAVVCCTCKRIAVYEEFTALTAFWAIGFCPSSATRESFLTRSQEQSLQCAHYKTQRIRGWIGCSMDSQFSCSQGYEVGECWFNTSLQIHNIVPSKNNYPFILGAAHYTMFLWLILEEIQKINCCITKIHSWLGYWYPHLNVESSLRSLLFSVYNPNTQWISKCQRLHWVAFVPVCALVPIDILY